MYFRKFNKTVSLLALATFLFTNNAVYAAPASRSIFKNKKIDYQKLSTENEQALQQKESALKNKIKGSGKLVSTKRDFQPKLIIANLKDLSAIHIPESIGKIVEAYEAPYNESQGASHEARIVVHIQDLHTNPEAQFNSAKILEILLKDYDLGLVCSEGADGMVDTSSVSSFPDPEVREKTAKLFVESGELTGEEYLSITKYPNLPIWGIENKDIYFKNIQQFNDIMKFNQGSEDFISEIKRASEGLKPKIYSKQLLEIDAKGIEYAEGKIDPDKYLYYLLSLGSSAFGKASEGNGLLPRFKNAAIFKDTLEFEKSIDQPKIMQESQNLLLDLQAALKDNNTELNILVAKAQLFKDKKISPFYFYSYIKNLAQKYLKDNISKYIILNNFIDYLAKVNSLDSMALFKEIDDLTYEIKKNLSQNDDQRMLIDTLYNIKFLENFFNLKLSNEEFNYYLNINKDDFRVARFKAVLTNLTGKTNSSGLIKTIDFNPAIIDNHLQEIEDFYNTVKERDKAMFNNAIAEMNRRDVKVAALITGGFHTQGLTKRLKENGYSYLVVTPYSNTEIDEENYRNLLSGKRKPIEELIKEFDNASSQTDNKTDTKKDMSVK